MSGFPISPLILGDIGNRQIGLDTFSGLAMIHLFMRKTITTLNKISG